MFADGRPCWPIDDRMTTGSGRSGRSNRSASGQLHAVLLGHEHVEDRGVEFPAVPDPAERLVGRGGRRSRRRPSDPGTSAMIRRLVALSSTTRTRQPRMLRSGAGGGASGSVVTSTGRASRKVLPSPGTPLLVRAQRAAHRFGQATADREPEARAAVASRDRRVDLAERLEQEVHPLGRGSRCLCPGLRWRPPRGRSRIGGRVASTDMTTSPCSVNLIALDSRLRTIWRSRPCVADDRLGQPVAHRVRQLDALLRGRSGRRRRGRSRPTRAARTAPPRGRPCRPRSWRSRGCR